MRPFPLVAVLVGTLVAAAPPIAAQTRPADAAAVVVDYYRAIDRGDFQAGYALWGDHGRASGKRYAAFARGFAATARTRAAVGRPGRAEGAAGSVYVTVPVEVHATLKNGRRQHFRGSYVLRRVGDVPGATPTQRAWHIDSARLRPV